jgi:hypothetical protein
MGKHVSPQRPYKCEPKRCYKKEDSKLTLSGLVNTITYRKIYSTRAEGTHTATVCALSLRSVVRKNIAVHFLIY